MEKLWIGSMVIFLIIICPVFLIFIASHWPFAGIMAGWTAVVSTAFIVYKVTASATGNQASK